MTGTNLHIVAEPMIIAELDKDRTQTQEIVNICSTKFKNKNKLNQIDKSSNF